MHSITTNGTLLDEDKLDLLSGYDVSLKVSVNGPAELHDRNRVYRDGSGTFAAVIPRPTTVYRFGPR